MQMKIRVRRGRGGKTLTFCGTLVVDLNICCDVFYLVHVCVVYQHGILRNVTSLPDHWSIHAHPSSHYALPPSSEF